MNKQILVTDKVHPSLLNGLKNMGMRVNYQPKMPYDEVKIEVGKYSGIIINSKVVCDATFLKQNTHLDFIGRLGSGLDIIDLPMAKSLGITVINSPEGNANAVAEHALGMLLNLLNNISRAHHQVRDFEWNREPNRGIELIGKTVGILGFGHTGSAVARKLQSWDVEIITYDKYKIDINKQYPYVNQVTLSELQSKSDILSIHLPLTKETRDMINADFLSKCKNKSIIINTSRGQILNTKDLLTYIESNHISGACLDVIQNEKLETLSLDQREIYQQLFAKDQVILTPHIAGWTHRSLVKIAHILLEKIRKYYDS